MWIDFEGSGGVPGRLRIGADLDAPPHFPPRPEGKKRTARTSPRRLRDAINNRVLIKF